MWLIITVGVLFLIIVIDILISRWSFSSRKNPVTIEPRSWWGKYGGFVLKDKDDINGPARDDVYIRGPWKKSEPMGPENKEDPNNG